MPFCVDAPPAMLFIFTLDLPDCRRHIRVNYNPITTLALGEARRWAWRTRRWSVPPGVTHYGPWGALWEVYRWSGRSPLTLSLKVLMGRMPGCVLIAWSVAARAGAQWLPLRLLLYRYLS